jgi:hypothetical protein
MTKIAAHAWKTGLLGAGVMAVSFAVGPAAADTSSTHVPAAPGSEAHTAEMRGSDAFAPSGLPDPEEALILPAVADHLRDLPGFAGLRVDEDRWRVTSHWVGQAPAEAVDYARSRPGGVTVVLVEGAAYSRADLLRAAGRIMDSPAGEAAGVAMLAPRWDGAGLTIDVTGETPGPELAAELAQTGGLAVEDIRYVPGSGVDVLPAALDATE